MGSYSEWEQRQKSAENGTRENGTQSAGKAKTSGESGRKPKTPSKKLSYREKQELESLPETISAMETRIAEIEQSLADPLLYQGDEAGEKTRILSTELQELNITLENAYERWDVLEQKQG
ncbi:hypothetical protein [Salinispira pacifica]|uniref:hypothetical protein n=1 Tax=Salinispira pacifica TaxID=1307761 RepID=UPI003CC775F0